VGILAIVADDEDDMRAFLLCFPGRHPGFYSKGTGLVGRGSDDCALCRANYGNRLPADLRVALLFDRCKKCVRVGMKDDPVFAVHCISRTTGRQLKIINALTEFLARFEKRYLVSKYFYCITSFRVSRHASVTFSDGEAA